LLALHLGVAGQQLMTTSLAAMTTAVAPGVPSSSSDATPPAATPPAPAVTAESSVTAPHPDPSDHDQPSRPVRQRLERLREGRHGSRTYEHPPWRTSEYLLPSSTQPGADSVP
jgi:hypothetical protein